MKHGWEMVDPAGKGRWRAAVVRGLFWKEGYPRERGGKVGFVSFHAKMSSVCVQRFFHLLVLLIAAAAATIS